MSSSNKFVKLSHEEHVLKLPDSYIGSTEKSTEEMWYYSKADGKMVKGLLTFVPGEFKIFDEIVVNALDQFTRTTEKPAKGEDNYPVKNIKVTYNKETGEISVFNDGEGIPVELHEKEKIYIPELIFGNLLTSSNYDQKEKKHVGGKNGYGAKLTNIFSKSFTIETIDEKNKLKFTQTFRDNMKVKEKPKITKNSRKPYTQVTYIPDYARFKQPGLTDDMIKIIEKRTYDMAAWTDNTVNVYLNGEKIESKNFEKYVDLYIGGKSETPRAYEKVNNRWEVVACLNPNVSFEQVSFVNGIQTYKGGKHVDTVLNSISKRLAEIILKKNKISVKPVFIKENIMLFIKSTIDNPSFNSQTKECLTTNASQFGSKCELSQKFIDQLSKCGIIEKALQLSSVKDMTDMKKSDGKKRNRITGIPKLDDANMAGTKESEKCTLILTEGDSAKALALSGLSIIGRNYYGVFPLKGKMLNVQDIKNMKKLMENTEINMIKKIIGLQVGKEYTSLSELRYGKILVLTDQDEDGSHIKGLLFNMFKTMWPTLFKYPGFLTGMLTPIVKAKSRGKGKNKDKELKFYSVKDFDKWKENNNDGVGWDCKYYKGLGTSTPAEAKEYFREFKLVIYTGDEKTDNDSIELAFGKTKGSSDERKNWLSGYDREHTLDYTKKKVSVADFVHRDLIHFSNSDNIRSIPSVIDGLKPSQRKVLFGCFKRKLTKEIRVAQLAGYISEHCAYHHGEASLQSTIVGMAQDFVGSNNINLLFPNGQFGSRVKGGKDSAQPRYIYTRLTDTTLKIFNSLDNPVLTYNNDDGLQVEPEFYVPIIPMILVNGATGIGTGWSTDIPCYNPLDLIKNIRLKLAGKDYVSMKPWFRGFKGNVFEVETNHYITKGIYTIKGNTLKITELPIGVWTEKYKETVESFLIDSKNPNKKQYVRNYTSQSTDCDIDFEIVFAPGVIANLNKPDTENITKLEKLFKLVSVINTSNMVYYDSQNRIRKTDSVFDILDEFIKVRLEYFTKRKVYMLKELKKVINLLEIKMRFIKDFINGKIKIMNVSKSQIVSQLIKLGYPSLTQFSEDNLECNEGSTNNYDILLKMPIYNLTKEKIDELQNKLDTNQSEYTKLEAMTREKLWEKDIDTLVNS